MSYLVSWFGFPKWWWDIELNISRIYEDIAVYIYEYTMGEAAQSHRTALIKSRCQKVVIDVE